MAAPGESLVGVSDIIAGRRLKGRRAARNAGSAAADGLSVLRMAATVPAKAHAIAEAAAVRAAQAVALAATKEEAAVAAGEDEASAITRAKSAVAAREAAEAALHDASEAVVRAKEAARMARAEAAGKASDAPTLQSLTRTAAQAADLATRACDGQGRGTAQPPAFPGARTVHEGAGGAKASDQSGEAGVPPPLIQGLLSMAIRSTKARRVCSNKAVAAFRAAASATPGAAQAACVAEAATTRANQSAADAGAHKAAVMDAAVRSSASVAAVEAVVTCATCALRTAHAAASEARDKERSALTAVENMTMAHKAAVSEAILAADTVAKKAADAAASAWAAEQASTTLRAAQEAEQAAALAGVVAAMVESPLQTVIGRAIEFDSRLQTLAMEVATSATLTGAQKRKELLAIAEGAERAAAERTDAFRLADAEMVAPWLAWDDDSDSEGAILFM